jgi:hypothetical protein
MNTVWAQRREELLSDCLVSPDVFTQMVDRLDEFVVPYQQALETEAGQHPMHLYLQGLLSHVQRKNAGSCTSSLRIIVLPRKPDIMPPLHHRIRGPYHDSAPVLLHLLYLLF